MGRGPRETDLDEIEAAPEEVQGPPPESPSAESPAAPGEAPQPGRPKRPHGPTQSQREWLKRGLDDPQSKLPLFDGEGQEMDQRTIQACLENGWAESWFENPLRPGVPVCRLTEKGRVVAPGRRRRDSKIEDESTREED
jgi:hypothetical protein